MTVGDEECGAALGGGHDVADEFVGGRAVEVGGGFVQDQYGGIRQQRSRQDQTLTFAAGDARAAFSDSGGESVRLASYPGSETDSVERVEKLVVGGARFADHEVLADLGVEDVVVLPAEHNKPTVRRFVESWPGLSRRT